MYRRAAPLPGRWFRILYPIGRGACLYKLFIYNMMRMGHISAPILVAIEVPMLNG